MGVTLAPVCHVMPLIGTIPIADVQRDDLRRMVSYLDDKARVGFYPDT